MEYEVVSPLGLVYKATSVKPRQVAFKGHS